MNRRRVTFLLAGLLLVPSVVVAAPKSAVDGFAGRWDMTVTASEGKVFPSWLQVEHQGEALSVSMVGRVGSVVPVPDAAIDNGVLVFKTKAGAPPVETVYRGKRMKSGKGLDGTVTTGDGASRPWVAVRAPAWKTPKGAAAQRKPARAVALFNGTDVGGWLPADKTKPVGWVVADGALDNQGRANNIYSDRKFSDFKLQVEFNVGPKSNSGVYLRGRYEIQILDDAGLPPESHGNGSLYGFITPSTNASKPAGEWQTLEATLVGNRATVVLNGTTVIDDEEIPGVTGGALDSDEARPGPIMLQGDHGPIQYRKVVVTPFK